MIDTRDQKTKEAHERTRSEWEPRGNHVHACLEAFLLKQKPLDPGNYKDWVDPLLSYDFWNRWEAVACEHRMVDLTFPGGIAGSADCVLRHKESGNYALADLKTLSASGRKRDISSQLGGYLSLLNHCHPDIPITKCFAVWSKPNKTFTSSYKTHDCIAEYEKKREAFFTKQPQI